MRGSRPSSAKADVWLSSDTSMISSGKAAALRRVSALGEEQVRIRDLDDRAHREILVRRAIVERLGDAVADEVAEVAWPIGRRGALVVEPPADVRAVHDRLELGPQRRFVRNGVLPEAAVDVGAGHQKGDEV